MAESIHPISPIATYVHLGPNLPRHLKLGLNRHQWLFPAQDIILITSHDQHFDLPVSIKQFKVNTTELAADLFLEMSQKLDFDFRSGFWKYTLQRFFAIQELHKEVPERALTHIESDVIIMPNFPWEEFGRLKKLAWLKVNSELDVAAIVHFPGLDQTTELLKEISLLMHLNPGTNDMLVLHDAAKNLKKGHIYLPSLTSYNSYEHANFSLSNQENLELFGGTFDPLNLGLWHFGQDPKNSFGLRKRYVGDSSHDLNASKAGLKFEDGILSDHLGTQVFSLHLHSKHLPLFESQGWETALKFGLLESQDKKSQYSFEFNALYLAIRGRSLRKTIWILISLIPGLKHLRGIRFLENLKDTLKKLIKI
jgi:hypothetical protein